MTNTIPLPIGIFVGYMLLSVFYWFYLCANLFGYLEKKHPDIYREMGSPTLIANNSPKNNISFLSFILRNKYSVLDDRFLDRRCKFMKYYLYTYCAIMGAFTISMFSLGGSS